MKLEIKNISKSFAEKKVLENVSFSLENGEIISLLGVSGSGKTTLFNIIAGLLKPDIGEILLNDKIITNTTGNVSYMLQKDLLLPYKTVLDNVILPLLIKGYKKKDAIKKAEPLFKTFGLDGYQKKYPQQMSGGMCQRAGLLRTYLFSDNVALLDEPFSALDTITKRNLQKWYLGVIKEIKLSTIFITHDIDEAIFLSNKVYILGKNPSYIIDKIEINYDFERNDDFILSQEFLDYKRHIMSILNNM